MRLSLLQMTFGKHIERKHCCFFPGGILDEVIGVLNHIQVTPSGQVGRPYKVTDELFDLSTMAMEYFKEHIEPALPDLVYFSKSFLDFSCKPLPENSVLKPDLNFRYIFQQTRSKLSWSPRRPPSEYKLITSLNIS